MESNRRAWFGTLAAGFAALRAQDVSQAAVDEAAWAKISESFPVDRSILNFNHAGIGTSPKRVVDAVVKRTWEGERFSPHTIFSYGPQLEPVRKQLADMLGCDAEEVAITRNATESLNAVLLGIPLKAGDEVLTTSLDYWAMLDALEQRRERDGVVVTKLRVPVPCVDLTEIVKTFEAAIGPKTKLILISHPINLNGQLFPVRELSRMAHARGVEVVVDAAQSFGLTEYKMNDLECDYLGTSLHKWLQAPKGTGLLYVKRDKIGKIWPLFAAGGTRKKDDIRKFELFGTWPETILAIDEAIAFHNAIGGTRKEARLRYLTKYWLDQIKGQHGIRLHTGIGQALSCGITCVEIDGVTSGELRTWLIDERKILTMDVSRRTSEFSGVRISPGLSTTKAELNQLTAALLDARRALKRFA